MLRSCTKPSNIGKSYKACVRGQEIGSLETYNVALRFAVVAGLCRTAIGLEVSRERLHELGCHCVNISVELRSVKRRTETRQRIANVDSARREGGEAYRM